VRVSADVRVVKHALVRVWRGVRVREPSLASAFVRARACLAVCARALSRAIHGCLA
jgi:hypothetical protein